MSESVPAAMRMRLAAAAVLLLAVLCMAELPAATAAAGGTGSLDGVLFANQPGTLYAPVRPLAERLGLSVHWDEESGSVYLNGREVSEEHLRQLPDGTRLLELRALQDRGLRVTWDPEQQVARVERNGTEVGVRQGKQRVAISLDAQQMRAWQGDLLVLDTRVSTGRPSKPTPAGDFTAGPLKSRLLISELYGNARMPWSVQIYGDYVIHGFRTVPPRAASHGCVRVPLTGSNPARWFYQWVRVGTPITIQHGWPEDVPSA